MKDQSSRSNLGDGRHIIFVNGDYKNEKTRLGKLVHDFKCSSPDDMYYKVLANGIRHFKETEGGRGELSKFVESIMIETSIDTCQELGMAESQILKFIMKKYDLTEMTAREYMDACKKSA